MLIWTRWGIVVAGIVLLAGVAAVLLASVMHITGRSAALLFYAALIPAGVATWYIGKGLNRDAVQELINPQTGQPVLLKNYHTFFFVRVEWWGPVMTVIGAVMLVLTILVGSS